MRSFHIIAFVIPLGLVLVPSAVGHHSHLSIDTPSGSAGEQAIIAAGYYPTEADVGIDSEGHLLDGEEILVFDAIDTLTGAGAQDGWAAMSELTLTSDFFFATGRLDGGDFWYELADVRAVGGGGAAHAAWLVAESTIELRALSSAETRAARSFNVGIGSHEHGQIFAISQQGVYDVTLIGWDSNGLFADSEPVIVRIDATAGPLPCEGDLNGDHAVNLSDLGIILSDFGCSADCVADWNGDGVVNLSDLGTVLSAYGQTCP